MSELRAIDPYPKIDNLRWVEIWYDANSKMTLKITSDQNREKLA